MFGRELDGDGCLSNRFCLQISGLFGSAACERPWISIHGATGCPAAVLSQVGVNDLGGPPVSVETQGPQPEQRREVTVGVTTKAARR